MSIDKKKTILKRDTSGWDEPVKINIIEKAAKKRK